LSEHAASVVHQDVHTTRSRRRRGGAGVDCRPVAHVGDNRATRSFGRAAQRFGLSQLVLEHVARPHACAALGERHRNRAPESVRRTGDDRRLAAEVEVHGVTM
jgi:hypothetical protein